MRLMEYLSIVRSWAVESLQILLYFYLNNGFSSAVFKMAQCCRIMQKIIG